MVTSNGDAYASIDILTLPYSQHRGLYQVLGGGGEGLDWEGGCLKTLCLATGQYHATQAGESCVGCQKIFQPHCL